MARTGRPKPTASDLLRRLEVRYGRISPPQSPEWALLKEVRVPRPDSQYRFRSADAVAIGLWPSTHYEVHGFEIKVSRSDWLQELREPSKADTVARFCNAWWLVVADAAIVRDDLPEAWGLLVPHGASRLRAVRTPRTQPAQFNQEFAASLISRALVQHRACRGHGFHNGWWKGYEKGRQEGSDHVDRLIRYYAEERRGA